MNVDPHVPDIDDTPEYPLSSPTDPLPRDQRPPDDETDVERAPADDSARRDSEADPDDPDRAGDDSQGQPS